MRRTRTLLVAGTTSIMMAVAFAPAALADNVVSQTVDSNGAGVGGIRDVSVGATTTVSYWVDATGRDGCDATASSPAVVSLHADPSVTITPSSLTFTSCGDHATNTQSVTFSGSTPGTYDVTTTVTDTVGTYNAGPADFKLRVIAPTEESPVDPCAGLVVPEAPLISTQPAVADGTEGWFLSAPVVSASSSTSGAVITWSTDGVTWSATAPVPAEGLSSVHVRAESLGAGGVSCGHTATTRRELRVDSVDPTITLTGTTPAPNADGWNNSDVTVSWSCADATSGPLAGSDSATISTEGVASSVTGTCTDHAGRTASERRGADLDKTAPSLNVVGAPDGTAVDVCAARPTRPTYAPADLLSGLDGSQGDSWTVPTTATGVGAYTYAAHAQDLADNAAGATRRYSVGYGGSVVPFLQPINTDGTSRFKLGSTIPVKVAVTCGSTPVSGVVARMYVAKGDNVPDPGVDEAVSTAASTTGNLFRDTGGGQYIFNLSTKVGYTNPGATTASAFTVGTWTLKIGLDDGTYRSVNVQLVK